MRKSIAWVFGGIALMLAGCGAATTESQWSNAAEARAAVRGPSGQYVLRPNDQVRVQVYNEESISGDYQVDGGGFISVPLAGRIRAAGLTPGQLEAVIASRLNRGIIKEPRVNVQVANYSPFYIHGEVKRAGEFPYRPGLTLMDAVATAGGFTYRANEGKAYVRRAGANTEKIYSLAARVPIFPGDNIRIPERFF